MTVDHCSTHQSDLIGVMGPEVVQQLAAEHEHEQLDASQDGEQLSKSERENLIRRLTSAWAHTPEIVRIRNDQDLLRGALAAIVMPDGRVCSGSCPQRPSILSAVAVLNELNENFNKESEMVADRMEKIAAEKKADSTAEAAEAAMRLVSTTARNIRGAKNEAKNGTINKGTYIKLSQLQSLGDFSVGDKRPADTTGESSQKESYLAQPRLRPMGCANTSEDRNKSYKTTNL